MKKLTYDKKELFDDLAHRGSNTVYVPENKYSLGIEVEFKCPTNWYNQKYNHEVRRKLYNDPYGYNSDGKSYYSTLGYDGSGPETKEFRSPVFIGDSPEECIIQLKPYVIEVEVYLIEMFNAKFLPYMNYKPLGIHFSTGGKWLKETTGLISRSKIIQPKLKDMLETEEDKELFRLREGKYSGKIPDSIHSKQDILYQYYCNAVRSNDSRLEFRYLPSAQVESIFPIIEFVLLDTSVPNNKIHFIK